MTATESKDHPLWNKFLPFARANGIDLQYYEDWYAWWECFLAGAEAQKEDQSKPDKDLSTTYAAGFQEGNINRGMFYGPCLSLNDVLLCVPDELEDGVKLDAFIFRYNPDGTSKKIYRWNKDTCTWEKLRSKASRTS